MLIRAFIIEIVEKRILVVSEWVVLSHGTLRFITGINWKLIISNDRLFGFPIICTDTNLRFDTSTIIDQLLMTTNTDNDWPIIRTETLYLMTNAATIYGTTKPIL